MKWPPNLSGNFQVDPLIVIEAIDCTHHASTVLQQRGVSISADDRLARGLVRLNVRDDYRQADESAG